MQVDKHGMVYGPPISRQFAPEFLVLERGRGSYVWDAAGNKYLDFGTGIAVNSLGHGRRDLAAAAARQMTKLVHSSNLYTSRPSLELAEKLVASGPFEAVAFGNSGAEANEAAFKFARLYARRTRGEGHHRFICFAQAFHGRTMGSLSLTPTAAYREAFEPLVPDVDVLPFNDAGALEAAVEAAAAPGGNRYAGLIVEAIQGEGGLARIEPDFVSAINRVRAKHDLVVIADEVQTGLGRTGALYASTAAGLEADILTLAKPLAGGLPLSATLLPAKINQLLKPGDHGTTFGGGPTVAAVANVVWDVVNSPGFLDEVRARGERLAAGLARIAAGRSRGRLRLAPSVRGEGLLRGLEVSRPADPAVMKMIVDAARNKGLLVLRSGNSVIRLAPPLVISDRDMDKGLARLDRALSAVNSELKHTKGAPT